jgi:hypothetical protein
MTGGDQRRRQPEVPAEREHQNSGRSRAREASTRSAGRSLEANCNKREAHLSTPGDRADTPAKAGREGRPSHLGPVKRPSQDRMTDLEPRRRKAQASPRGDHSQTMSPNSRPPKGEHQQSPTNDPTETSQAQECADSQPADEIRRTRTPATNVTPQPRPETPAP